MRYTATELFKKYTGYDIQKLFEDYVFFSQNHYQNIVDYYSGRDIVQESFYALERLKSQVDKVESLIDQYSDRFDTTDFWELNNGFSDIQVKIETCINMGKWQRSSRLDRFSENLKITHIQKQNETLEKIARDAGFNEPNKWAELSLENQLIEEDYTNKGGAMLRVSLPNDRNFLLDNIVDYLIGENIYGKDIYKKIEIQSDGDILTLFGKNSLRQTFETIMSTIKGGIPEFPNDGVPNEIFGTNENIIQYPIIFRSLMNILQKDKRFNSLEILDIRKEQDSILIELQVSTIVGDTLTNNIII